MKPVAVATMTRARSPEETDRLIKALTALHRVGLPVYAADAGSDETFLRALSSLPNIQILRTDANLVDQVRTFIQQAAGTGVDLVLYSEPDKQVFFETHLEAVLS